MSKQIPLEFGEFSFEPAPKDKPAIDHTRVAKPNVEMVKEAIKKKSHSGRRSLKEPLTKEVLLPPDAELFEKTYYPIGEVAKMFGEQTSLIRFWANEFKVLKPRTNKKGDRYFRPEDVKSLYLIYHLLRERKFTIEGAIEFLKDEKSAGEKFEMITALEKVKLFLQQLKNNL